MNYTINSTSDIQPSLQLLQLLSNQLTINSTIAKLSTKSTQQLLNLNMNECNGLNRIDEYALNVALQNYFK